jgi:hypothetical protein
VQPQEILSRRPIALTVCRALATLAFVCVAVPCFAENERTDSRFENWGIFQRDTNETDQWTYQARLYIPFRLDDGWTFTQRIQLPMTYTNESGPGNPAGTYSGGIGNAFIEEIFETGDVAPNFRLRGSVRVVFPTGKQSPYGSGQYQIAPGIGFGYSMPDTLRGVTLDPYVRYSYGFDPDPDSVQTIRKWSIYPAAAFTLDPKWSLLLYPDNPITYNDRKRTWFVPIDFMFMHRFGSALEGGIGGAWRIGNSADASFRYLIDARLNLSF